MSVAITMPGAGQAGAGGFATRSGSDQEQALRQAQRHSRRVRFLRRALPVCAVLATGLYLVSAQLSVSFGPLGASVERIEVTRDSLRMVNPKLEGFDKEKGAYLVTADYAEQSVSSPHLIELHEIKAQMSGDEEDDWSRLTAKSGLFDTEKEFLLIEDEIRLSTGSGMSGRLEHAKIDMKKQRLTSDKPVSFDLIHGTVRSNRMEFDSSDRVLTFIGGVKVHIRKRAAANAETASKKVVARP